MTVSALNLTDLTALLSTSPSLPASQLHTLLSDQEADASLLFTDDAILDASHLVLLQLYYSSHLFSLLLLNDLSVCGSPSPFCSPAHTMLTNRPHLFSTSRNEARFLTHRFPPSMAQTDPILLQSKDVLRAVWGRRYQLVYQLIGKPTRWPDELRPLVQRYLDHFRADTLQLLSRAYTSIPLNLVAFYLGMDVKDVQGDGKEGEGEMNGTSSWSGAVERTELVRQLVVRGWGWDEEKGVFLPRLVSGKEVGEEVHDWDGKGGEEESVARLVALIGDLGE